MYQGNEMVELDLFETEAHRGLSCLDGITFSPKWLIEQKANLRFVKLWQILQPYPAYNLRLIFWKDAPIAITIFLPMYLLLSDEVLDFFQGWWPRVWEVA
jgi:hypothetical protein